MANAPAVPTKGGGTRAPSIWEVQYAEAQQRRAERHLLQQLYEVDQQRECSYKPTITNASKKIDKAARKRSASATMARAGSAPPERFHLAPRVEASRDGYNNIHESLYADAREKRRMFLVREAEAEAEIEAKARSHSAHRLRPEAFHRLCYAHRQKEVEMEALRDYLAHHEDPNTGRPLFKPHITRGPKTAHPLEGATASDTNKAAGSVSVGGPSSMEARSAADALMSPRLAQTWEGTLRRDGAEIAHASNTDSSNFARGHVPNFNPGQSSVGEGGGPLLVGLKAHKSGASTLITGEALHSYRVKEKAGRIKQSREALQQAALQEQNKNTNLPSSIANRGISGELVKSMREARIKELFQQLDSTGEGVIDGRKLANEALESLPPDVSTALRPLKSEYESEYLAFSDFRDLVNKALASQVPNGPRASLRNDRGGASVYAAMQAQRLREQQAECSFKPSINPKSKELAANKRDPSLGRNGKIAMHERLTALQAEYAAKREALQKAKGEEDDLECTFKPKVVTRGYRASGQTGEAAPRGPRPLPASSEDRELAEHCSFKPRLNHFAGAERRIDCDDPHKDPDLMAAAANRSMEGRHPTYIGLPQSSQQGGGPGSGSGSSAGYAVAEGKWATSGSSTSQVSASGPQQQSSALSRSGSGSDAGGGGAGGSYTATMGGR